MPTGSLARAFALALLCALASCAGARREPLTYAPGSSSYPAPGPPEDPWGPYITDASSRFSVPQPWIRAVMHQESGGHEYLDGQPITSGSGAMGLMQLMPDTYADLQSQYGLGGDPYDPHDNILAGTAYIRQMYDKYGSPGFLAAYNAGPARVDDYLAGVSGLPAETVDYVAAITPNLGGNTAPIELAAATPRRGSPAGCDADAAYDPSTPCATAGPVETAAADPVVEATAGPIPVRHDCATDPDAAFDPARPCATASQPIAQQQVAPPPTVQAVSYAIPAPSAFGGAISDGVPPPSGMRTALATTAPPRLTDGARTAPAATLPASYGAAGWGIQVGAFGQVEEARFATTIARDAGAGLLAGARSEIEPVRGLGGRVLYRARLAGLDRTAAARACTTLRGQNLPCMAVAPGA